MQLYNPTPLWKPLCYITFSPSVWTQHTPISILNAVNNNISTWYTFRDPRHFESFGLMWTMLVVFVQIMMLIKSFKFRYWCEPIRMQSDRHEQFVVRLRCDYCYHMLSIIKCENQQPVTGPNHDHVTDSTITWPNGASNWARKIGFQHNSSYWDCEKQNVSSQQNHIIFDKSLIFLQLTL